MGDSEEPKGALVLFVQNSPSEYAFVFSAGLTVWNADGAIQPRVAQKVPTIADGDWKILPDGQMEVTWKLRPDVLWHDGTPLTAADYEFGLRVLLDPEIPAIGIGGDGYTLRSIASAAAIDAQTLVVRWKQSYIYGNSATAVALPAMPRHRVADLYQQDKQRFLNSPSWSSEYVGIGPFKLANWESGSHIEGVAFDQYFLGRPKIDRVVIRMLPDPKALTINLIAGDIDIIPTHNLDSTALRAIKDTWDPIGGGNTEVTYSGIRALYPQLRDQSAPWVRDPRARQALTYMLDRQTMADTLQQGFTIPAEVWITPKDPTWPLLQQRGFKPRRYDLSEAQRLLAEAGWNRAVDGTYRDAAGQTFAIEVRGLNTKVDELTVLAAQFKAAGLAPRYFRLPTARRRFFRCATRPKECWPPRAEGSLPGPTT